METEYLKRWRMALGGNAADGTGVTLTVEEQRLDSSLEAVYDSDRRGGLGSSAPKVSRWLGDIREFFPQTVVQVIQRDAIKRLHIDSLLTEKEMLATVVPDVHLVATLMSLGRAIPEKNKLSACYFDCHMLIVMLLIYSLHSRKRPCTTRPRRLSLSPCRNAVRRSISCHSPYRGSSVSSGNCRRE